MSMVVDSVTDECNVCAACEKAPRPPVAGSSLLSAFGEEAQADLLLLDDSFALRATDLLSRSSTPAKAPSERPLGVGDTFAAPRISVFGKRRCFRMDSGGEWMREVGAGLRSERNSRLQFQGKDAHPWMLGRRNGLARGIYNKLHEDGHFAGRVIFNDAHYCLNAMLNQMAFWIKPG